MSSKFIPRRRFQEPKGLNEVGLSMPALHFPAKAFYARSGGIQTVGMNGLQTYSREDLIGMIERSKFGSFDETVDKERLIFFRALISNRAMDSYFTRMSKSSLKNYSEDLNNLDVTFADSHKRNENGFGRSVVGQYITDGTPPDGVDREEYFPAVIGDFYSHLDLKLGSMSVEQFWLALQTNVLQDVSIGFKEGDGFKMTCSHCGNDYWDWDCWHIAGYEYAMDNDDDPADSDGEPDKTICFVWIENARLSEVSAVYDGATPNATFVKAEREIRAGRMSGEVERYLETRFDFKRSKDTSLYVAENPFDKETRGNNPLNQKRSEVNKTMSDAKNPSGNGNPNEPNGGNGGGDAGERQAAAFVFNPMPNVREFAATLGIETDGLKDEALVKRVSDEVATVAAQAKQFQKFRSAAIDAALKQKVRSEGGKETFDEAAQETVRKMLESVGEIEVIQEFEREWKTKGDARHSSNRKTTDGEPEGEGDESGDDERGAIVLPKDENAQRAIGGMFD